jgi:hypothetical protein
MARIEKLGILALIGLFSCGETVSSTGSSSGTSSSSGGPTTIEEVCQSAFDALNNPACLESNLIEACKDKYATQLACQTEVFNYFKCLGETLTPSTCANADAYLPCKPASDALELCSKFNCSNTINCMSDPTVSCECNGACDKGPVRASCTAMGAGALCDCWVNGTVVGQCENPELNCQPFVNCCYIYTKP